MLDAPIPSTPATGAAIVPFPARIEPLVYAPGVAPFDRTNPAHVRAWNTLFALGWAERGRGARHA